MPSGRHCLKWSLASLSVLVGCLPEDGRAIYFEKCLAAAKASDVWIDSTRADVIEFSLVGNIRADDGGELNVFVLLFALKGMMCPRGVNHLLFHDAQGNLAATARAVRPDCIYPVRIEEGRFLVTADGHKYDFSRPGFLEWANGCPIEDFFYFGMTEEEWRSYK